MAFDPRELFRWQDASPNYVTVNTAGDRIVAYDPARVVLAFSISSLLVGTPHVWPVYNAANPFGFALSPAGIVLTADGHAKLAQLDWYAVTGPFPFTVAVISIRDERRFIRQRDIERRIWLPDDVNGDEADNPVFTLAPRGLTL